MSFYFQIPVFPDNDMMVFVPQPDVHSIYDIDIRYWPFDTIIPIAVCVWWWAFWWWNSYPIWLVSDMILVLLCGRWAGTLRPLPLESIVMIVMPGTCRHPRMGGHYHCTAGELPVLMRWCRWRRWLPMGLPRFRCRDAIYWWLYSVKPVLLLTFVPVLPMKPDWWHWYSHYPYSVDLLMMMIVPIQTWYVVLLVVRITDIV